MKPDAVGSGVHVRAQARGCLSLSGARLLVETARVSGLDAGLSVALERWRRPRSIHDPGKIVLDLG